MKFTGKGRVDLKKDMKKSNKGGALAGALVGAALGVAAGMLLAPASGKKLMKDAGKKSAEFLAYLSPRLKKAKKMGEAEYKVFIRDAARNYAKMKRLSMKEEKLLIAEAAKSWRHLKRHLA